MCFVILLSIVVCSREQAEVGAGEDDGASKRRSKKAKKKERDKKVIVQYYIRHHVMIHYITLSWSLHFGVDIQSLFCHHPFLHKP